MALDTPATIAVLGAGPIGLETALYARFLGYEVNVYERGEVGDNVQQWQHVQLFTPFGQNSTPLGLAALAAQDENFTPRDKHDLISGRQWLDEYLLPLARTDLLSGNIHTNTTVLGVGRTESLKHDPPSEDRGDEVFRLLLRNAAGQEFTEEADIVIDCTGVFGNNNPLGVGGIPALGEAQHQAKIVFGLPDILGEDRGRFAGRRVLVVGSGYSAATNVVSLLELDGSEITWATRQDNNPPITMIEDDALASRATLARAANEAVQQQRVVLLTGVQITQLDHDETHDTWDVSFQRWEGDEQGEEVSAKQWQQSLRS